MCLAVPMKVKSIKDNKAVVESYGIETTVDISLAPDIQVDDRVLIHAGFVIEKLDPEHANEIEETWDEYMKILEQENAG
jgi:hydrogenase expression/formation protein HypC